MFCLSLLATVVLFVGFVLFCFVLFTISVEHAWISFFSPSVWNVFPFANESRVPYELLVFRAG